MPDYKNSKIYKLVNHEFPDKIYIGSTTQLLSNRLASHKSHAKKKLTNSVSSQLFEKGEVNIVLLEAFECDSKIQLLQKEREYIEKLDCINHYIPLRTQKEWREVNRDKCIKLTKEWNDKNAEFRKTKVKCECGRIVARASLLRHTRTKFHLDNT